jgi:hypothetical protein
MNPMKVRIYSQYLVKVFVKQLANDFDTDTLARLKPFILAKV